MPETSLPLLPANRAQGAIPILPVTLKSWPGIERSLDKAARTWLKASGFVGQPGRHALVPDKAGNLHQVFYGIAETAKPGEAFDFARLVRVLPDAAYRIDGELPDLRGAVMGWLLETYRFERYRKPSTPAPRLVCPSELDRAALLTAAEAHFMVRDLVNTPSADMGPDELEKAARQVASRHRAKLRVIAGEKLRRDFPMVHTVGQASPRRPRLIDFTWGPARAPKVTLVGKGVCFDTGGLDIKPASGMLTMKKDMGGAANVLGLAQMIMAARLKLRLRVLIPAVENSIAGNAFRPGDVLTSRKGIRVEIGNTDAEGRLVLGDALALADEESPDLLIDMATLTGAARVALGPDLPPFYTDDEGLAADLARHAMAVNDPIWRMPFWAPYYALIESNIAELNNAGESGFAGSVTAALFLKRFVERARSYVHFDIFAWTPAAKPGRPKGGEAQAIHALFGAIAERYGK
ncbi:leucyl aminopeptidase family protein [Aestuariivirga sp. YIM B02566]|uniref:Leucyl aminopeptidase family protein n=1 Tax=Taklimakanibacter albus TaxID=2800327 RepID=A0ACC5REH9_9HYPH|nr:leucyl aminopeptidase family protein [Aestuariivirga sp. YIM B02566]MBK1870906.1 leucyl aminopeptidase family protein [Aestuariivirga sp. YIM B02566]